MFFHGFSLEFLSSKASGFSSTPLMLDSGKSMDQVTKANSLGQTSTDLQFAYICTKEKCMLAAEPLMSLAEPIMSAGVRAFGTGGFVGGCLECLWKLVCAWRLSAAVRLGCS